MALQVVTVTLTAQASKTFVFNKPVANYGKSAAGLSITDGSPPPAQSYIADVDNGNGTMTGTLNLSETVTGTATIVVYDTP